MDPVIQRKFKAIFAVAALFVVVTVSGVSTAFSCAVGVGNPWCDCIMETGTSNGHEMTDQFPPGETVYYVAAFDCGDGWADCGPEGCEVIVEVPGLGIHQVIMADSEGVANGDFLVPEQAGCGIYEMTLTAPDNCNISDTRTISVVNCPDTSISGNQPREFRVLRI